MAEQKNKGYRPPSVGSGPASWQVIQGDAVERLRELPDQSAQTCITSPPYFGLRDYGVDGQIGLEATPDEYVARLVEVFREVRRVLRNDGTLWLNLGDSYNAYNGNAGPASGIDSPTGARTTQRPQLATGHGKRVKALKPKDLLGIPWLAAFALRGDGWYLRSDTIWSKSNPMPESVKDRPTRSHEYLFLFAKSQCYFYDAEAIQEPAEYAGPNGAQHSPYGQGFTRRSQGKQAEVHKHTVRGGDRWDGFNESGRGKDGLARNKRSVWTISTKPYPDAHFATFPPDMVEPCILAGSARDTAVLDPFAGAGTTGLVALRHDRSFIGIELNADYCELARNRIRDDQPLLNVPAEAA